MGIAKIRDFGTLPPQLHWALFALNFSWSVLLAGVGLLVLLSAACGERAEGDRRLVFVVGAFWAVHGGYVAFVPMPLPTNLSWLRGPLIAFPVLLVVLHFGALGLTPNHRKTVAPVSR